MTADDIFRMEGVGETALSPDGQWLAYVRRRPVLTEPFRGYSELLKNDHADVWIARLAGGKPQNITNGSVDGSGYWAPRWSPDGRHLAMLSTKGGNIRLWIWSKSTSHLEMLCDRGIDVISVESFWDTYLWISDKQIVVAPLPQGMKPRAMADLVVAEKVTTEWAKARAGREPTTSILESGIPPSMENRPQAQAMVIDIVTKAQKQLTHAPGFGQYLLSPNKRYLAILKQVDVWRPDPNKMISTLNPVIYQLVLADIQADFKTRTISEITAPLQGSLLWSPDSKELALVGYTKEAASDQTMYRYRIADGRVRLVTNEMKDLGSLMQNRFVKPPMMWLKNGNILLLSPLHPSAIKGNESQLARWWVIDDQGHRRDFFEGIATIPSQILRSDRLGTLVGLIGGTLRRIGDDGQILEPIASNFNQKITSILLTDNSSAMTNFRSRLILSADSVDSRLIIRTDPQAAANLFTVDLSTGLPQPLSKPFPAAALIGWNATADTSLFLTADDSGTYISALPPGGKFVTILETNTFIRALWRPDFRKIQYRGLDGQDLTGWIMLPYGYKEGNRYPMVASIYPGSVYGDRPPRLWRWIDAPTPYNMQLLAAHGYAVLFPSMPHRAAHGERRDPYMELPKGLLPAVDEAVRIGVADSQRIGVLGASFGGFATYGILTQTNRFRAAVSICGPADLISLWGTFGTFDLRSRYDDYAHEDLYRMHNVETTFGPAGPPWKDLGAYLRNSPITYVDRVETPLMIMQGDLDLIGIEQGEQFFTSLYRQNKRARFVRYWGEDHTLMSPANVRDMWRRIIGWFDEYLKPLEKPESKEQ